MKCIDDHTYIDGTLEIDHENGKIYFRTTDPEALQAYKSGVVITIKALPKPVPYEFELEITASSGTKRLFDFLAKIEDCYEPENGQFLLEAIHLALKDKV